MQRSGDIAQLYIQNVLGLCQTINPNMGEENPTLLLKGVVKVSYLVLLLKKVSSTYKFVKHCRFLKEMNKKMIRCKKLERLSDVVPISF